jgi:hypothetical protein
MRPTLRRIPAPLEEGQTAGTALVAPCVLGGPDSGRAWASGLQATLHQQWHRAPLQTRLLNAAAGTLQLAVCIVGRRIYSNRCSVARAPLLTTLLAMVPVRLALFLLARGIATAA